MTVVRDVGDQDRRRSEDGDAWVVRVLALLDHRDEPAERLPDADARGIGHRGQTFVEGAGLEPGADLLVHGVGRVGGDLECHEVAVVRPAAVTPTQVVTRHEHDAAVGHPLGLAVAASARRLEIPIAAVVGATGDGQDHDRCRPELGRVGHDGDGYARSVRPTERCPASHP